MREIRLNAFEMNCVGHQSPGLWAYPRDRSASYTDLEYWTGLARTLERGKFDGIFLADVLGIYDVYGGSPDAALRPAVQVPVNDPVLLIPAMAQVTDNLGFGVTSTLSYEPPYPFARRMSTLDHLTKVGPAGTSSPATSTAPPPAWVWRRSPAMNSATRLPRNTWSSYTGCGKAAGRTARSSATGRVASSPTRRRSTASAIRAGSTASTRSICASRRRCGRRCCTRPGPPAAAVNSPRSTPNAFRSTVRAKGWWRRRALI